MLRKIYIENVKSFADGVEFDMIPQKIVERKRTEHVFAEDNLLRTSLVYGYLGTGKSNLAIILDKTIKFILDSFDYNYLNELDPFMLCPTNSRRSSKVTLEVDDGRNEIFIYSLEFFRGTLISEKLESKHLRRITIFERNNEGFIGQKDLQETYNMISGFVMHDHSFVSLLNKFNENYFKRFTELLKKILVFRSTPDFSNHTISFLENSTEAYKNKLLRYLKYFGLDIIDLDVRKHSIEEYSGLDEIGNPIFERKERKYLVLLKNKFENGQIKNGQFWEMPFEKESAGTRKLINMGGVILDALENGKTIIFDEFDDKLHVFAIRRLLDFFIKKRNSSLSQLILITHNISLVNDYVFRDEIWLFDKDDLGRSSVNRLNRLENRQGTNIYEKFMRNKYNLNYGYKTTSD